MKCTAQIGKPVTGVFADSAFGGIEIIGDIEHAINDYVFWRYNYGEPEPIHRAKIYYSRKGAYFNTPRGRVHFNNIMRI